MVVNLKKAYWGPQPILGGMVDHFSLKKKYKMVDINGKAFVEVWTGKHVLN